MVAAVSSDLAPDNEEIVSPISAGCSTGIVLFRMQLVDCTIRWGCAARVPILRR